MDLGKCKAFLSRNRLAIIIGLGILVFIGLFAPACQDCISANQKAYTQYPPKEGAPGFIGIAYWCVGAVIKDSSEAITALATLAIGVFTATLWVVTDGSLKLARQEFLSTHRPKVRVRAVAFEHTKTDGQQMAISFTAVNIGDSPCKITQVSYQFSAATKDGEPVTRKITSSKILLEKAATLAPGEPAKFTTHVVAGNDLVNLGNKWDIFGFIVYDDDMGIRRFMGYWRRYNAAGEEWTAPDNPDFNYEY